MLIKFLAGAGPESYAIQGSVINGIDFAEFVEGSQFVGDDETKAAGIFGAKWEGGELHVTLAQPHGSLQVPAVSNNWEESGWMDSESYSPSQCYIRCVSPGVPEMIEVGKAEHQKVEGVWTVVPLEDWEDA